LQSNRKWTTSYKTAGAGRWSARTVAGQLVLIQDSY